MSGLVKGLGEEDIHNEDASKDEPHQHAWYGGHQEDPLLHLNVYVSHAQQ